MARQHINSYEPPRELQQASHGGFGEPNRVATASGTSNRQAHTKAAQAADKDKRMP